MAKVLTRQPRELLPKTSPMNHKVEWASDFMCSITGEFMYGHEYAWSKKELEDLKYAIKLEKGGLGLLIRPRTCPAELASPKDPYVVMQDSTFFDRKTLERFFEEEAQLQFGNSAQRELIDAYEYIELFRKYRQYTSWGGHEDGK